MKNYSISGVNYGDKVYIIAYDGKLKEYKLETLTVKGFTGQGLNLVVFEESLNNLFNTQFISDFISKRDFDTKSEESGNKIKIVSKSKKITLVLFDIYISSKKIELEEEMKVLEKGEVLNKENWKHI